MAGACERGDRIGDGERDGERGVGGGQSGCHETMVIGSAMGRGSEETGEWGGGPVAMVRRWVDVAGGLGEGAEGLEREEGGRRQLEGLKSWMEQVEEAGAGG